MQELPGSQGSNSKPVSPSISEPELYLTPENKSFSTPELSIDSLFNVPEQSTESTHSMSDDSTSLNEQERNFALLLEQFLESVQSGNDDRTKLLSDIINECNTVLADGSISEDYKQFCKLLNEFLKYISDNQYFDDIRVMNILSNIQDPFAQWARSKPNNRTGILASVNDVLRDFKTMFE